MSTIISSSADNNTSRDNPTLCSIRPSTNPISISSKDNGKISELLASSTKKFLHFNNCLRVACHNINRVLIKLDQLKLFLISDSPSLDIYCLCEKNQLMILIFLLTVTQLLEKIGCIKKGVV